ncbi:MAG: chemotaxis protein CheW [Thermanaerothrix sp.]|nr:chemotaxis protein CheW [Thermanaerothrix sp.]
MRVENRHLALPLEQVVRAVPAALLTPSTGEGPVAGMLNLSGEMVPVLDLRGILGVPRKDMATSDAIVLARSGDDVLGIWVDEVLGVFEARSRTRCTVMGQPLDAVVMEDHKTVAVVLNIGGMISEGP